MEALRGQRSIEPLNISSTKSRRVRNVKTWFLVFFYFNFDTLHTDVVYKSDLQ